MDINMDLSDFWKSISILIKNYHAVNKKIFACKTVLVNQILEGMAKVNFQIESNDEGEADDESSLVELKTLESTEVDVIKALSSYDSMGMDTCEGYMISMKFITKDDDENIIAVGIVDFVNTQYTCTLMSNTCDDFRVAFNDGELVVTSLTNRRKEDEPDRWINYVLKPKLLKWANCAERPENSFESLRLIDVEYYNTLYKKLKDRYSKALVNIWEESTDPLKFVYEDLAIAAYLICLWREHHCYPKQFADLGCGNGLLVYILNQEGFRGCGYDVRSRKIWSLFPKATLLYEKTIEPSKFKVPPEIDWIIGNHSDELSAWIPTMAALGSTRMKYFLLPCCPFEFSGQKFQRRHSNVSSYNDFLNYVETISKRCGFLTLRDRLKIPSTKRIAIIGIARTYGEPTHDSVCSGIQEFLTTEMEDNPMKLREKVEPVRNCTQIDSDIINRLVQKIFYYLIGPEKEGSSTSWNAGEKRTIKEIVQHLSQEDLKNVKSECGGIKTLLKNKHEVFEFLPQDFVQIRRPKPMEASTSTAKLTIKKRVCFFQTYHPDGCPLTAADCTFIHLN